MVEKNARERSVGWWRTTLTGPSTSEGLRLPSSRSSWARCLWVVVPLQPEVVLRDQLLPGLRPSEVEVREPALQVEVGLDEGLPGLPALDLHLLYVERGVDGLGPVGAEDPAPVGDDGLG
jgi:hypothetical protein